MDARHRAVNSIEEAQLALDHALSELDAIPSVDPHIVGFAAHALNSCANTTTAAAELLQHTLAGYPDPEVATWLDGIHHAAHMRSTWQRRRLFTNTNNRKKRIRNIRTTTITKKINKSWCP